MTFELWTPCRCLACIVRHLYQVPFFMETGLQNLVAQIGLWTRTGTPKTMTPYGGARLDFGDPLRWGVWTLNSFPLLVKNGKTQ